MFIIRNGRPIPTNDVILRYTRQALFAGYSYDAIRKALRTRHNDSTIDHHFHLLQMHDYKPVIRFDKPVERNIADRAPLIMAIKIYIKAQKAQGFDQQDIKNALLHYGHDKSIVEESFKNV
jgi:DNA-binding transcriptional MerR regulator